MSRLGRARERRSGVSGISSPEDWLTAALGGRMTSSGALVNADSAMRHADVYACIKAISQEVASCPLKHYRRLDDDSREAFRPPAGTPWSVLSNPMPGLLTSGALFGLVAAHLNGWGNAFVAKYRASGAIVRLFPIHPSRVAIGVLNGEPFYDVAPTGVSPGGRFNRRDVIHFKGLSLDGIEGLSPIAQARESIGLGISQEEFAGRTFANDATPRGVLYTSLKGLDKNATDRLRAEFEAIYSGRNGSSVAILDKTNDKFDAINLSPADIAFVEQRKMSTSQIARVFSVPPFIIGASTGDSMTYSTVEGQRLAFAMACIRYWFSNIEVTLTADPDLYPDEGVYGEFLMDAMLRADSSTRARNNALAVGRWKTPNEIRREEGDPDIEGGDELAPPSVQATPDPFPTDPATGAQS